LKVWGRQKGSTSNDQASAPVQVDEIDDTYLHPTTRQHVKEDLVTVSERTSGPVIVLDVKGALTLTDGADLLRDKVRSLLQQGLKHMLVNLGQVPYMDSGGLGELVQSYATVTRQGGQLKLLNTTQRINDLLVITKLSTIFDLFDNEAAAVRSFT
jgi:anti-sigma B factor antagonist